MDPGHIGKLAPSGPG